MHKSNILSHLQPLWRGDGDGNHIQGKTKSWLLNYRKTVLFWMSSLCPYPFTTSILQHLIHLTLKMSWIHLSFLSWSFPTIEQSALVVVQSLSCVWFFATPRPQHARLPCPSPSPGVCSNSYPFVDDAIQPSHPLSPPSPTLNLTQHQGLFQWVSSFHQVAKVLELHLWHQSFQWMNINLVNQLVNQFRID